MEEKQKNLLKAIGASLGVALVGAVLWGVLYQFGWFVGIVAYFTSFAMIKLFNKFYDEECKWKYAYVSAVIIVFNVIASFIGLARYAAKVWNVDFGEAFSTLLENFSVIATDFIIDMVVGIVFMVLGIVSVVKLEKRRIAEKRYYEQQKQLEEQTSTETKEQAEQTEAETETKETENNDLTKETETKEEQSSAEENKTTHKFCTSCGSKLNEGDKVCSSCGAPVEE